MSLLIFADPEFHLLQNVCDTHYNASNGERSVVGQDEEDKVWKKLIINLTTPHGLRNVPTNYAVPMNNCGI